MLRLFLSRHAPPLLRVLAPPPAARPAVAQEAGMGTRWYSTGGDAPGPPPVMEKLQKKTEDQVRDLIAKARAGKEEGGGEGEGEGDDGLGDFVNRDTGEEGGPKGLEPTRFGDWEQKGRCTDF